MSESPPPFAAFERPERAEAVWRSLSQALGSGLASALIERGAGSGDPEAILGLLDRISPALRRVEPPDPGRLHALFAASDFLCRLLAGRPGLFSTLAPGKGEKGAETYLQEAKSHAGRAHDRPALVRQLRRYKYRELLRITARDAIDGAPMDELGRELAHLAAALIRAAFDVLAVELTQRFGKPEGATPGLPFCALALGKLGGEDLNFSSDVDLVYLYRAEGQTDAQLPNAKLFTRLAEALTQTLSTPTADGFCYRVDLNLRPQGRAGAIALSLPAMLQYYQSFGRTWERAALIKAHPVAGDDALGRELLDGLRPFIWRRSVDHGVVDELREMRAQIGLRGKASAEDIKLGRGGIREIEFFVSSLQLLHGGKNPELRDRRTLRALRKLEQAGLIASPEADRLEDAYRFLRRVENRLQMLEERQAQSLPAGERERLRLARSLGFEDTGAFEVELGGHRDFVEKAFTQLLGRVAREEIPDEPLIALALDLDAPREERIAALEERGFTRPEDGAAVIDRLSRARGSPFARGAAGPGLQALRWMAEIVRTPDPDQALTHFAELVAVLASPEAYLGFLERFPRAARRLMNLFGQSDYLSRYFLGHPDLVEWLVQGDADPVKSPDRLQRELSSRVARQEEPEERLGALRRYKNEEILRIALADISGESQVPEVAAQLSAIADGVLDEALHLAQAEQRARYGDPRGSGGEAPLAVVGMGKLGGREMGYHSDLDLLFVYGGSGTDETSGGERGTLSHHEYFAK
ncbi:MAG TPA: bifunctional [glutamate--ammonia ligase]-adenylyl-L-tyrosine phosphorylase/[glutamate--ammonia-ligase] adenylyltransferase, partial [Myxococcaceae bacterium]|nr:bifunctional [glutamate--ammonia ligase]-adenylyl-L-tyrosine phosphorylase/[glutamate--ammonia-ligase] adenylyltransferase [Myxococcaceae bacterium]